MCKDFFEMLNQKENEKENNMPKFDVVVMNPPYQAPKAKEHKGRGKCGKSIWENFVEKSFSLIEDGGFCCHIHPERWRKPNNEIGNIIQSKQIVYLEMHNTSDGKNVFGCNTNYDWYILQNKSIHHKTVIVDYNGKLTKQKLKDVPFIPNTNIDFVFSLIAKKDEDKVELLHSYSAYETRKEHMSKEKTKKYKYPCVYTVGGNNTGFWYSSKKEQFFGIPKVIWGNGLSHVIVDRNGNYGLTQFAYGIADKISNLNHIKQALKSEKFIKNVMGYTKGVGHIYDKNIIATFRKDFWKEFI